MLGLIILRLDPIILKGRVLLNVDVSGLDPVIMKGRIIQDVSGGLDPVITKGSIFLYMYLLGVTNIGSSAKT